MVEVMIRKEICGSDFLIEDANREPYIVFIDAANRALPTWLADKNLKIHGSNLYGNLFAD